MVSEIFPLEIRAMAIAFFYAVATGAGGFIGPVLFGALIQTATPVNVFYGYLLGAVLVLGAGLIEAAFGVEAAGKSLEEIAAPPSLPSFRPGPSADGIGVWSLYPASTSSDSRVDRAPTSRPRGRPSAPAAVRRRPRIGRILEAG
jgi:MFS family permease